MLKEIFKDGTKIFKRVCRSSRLLLQFHAGKSTFILHFPTFNNWPSFLIISGSTSFHAACVSLQRQSGELQDGGLAWERFFCEFWFYWELHTRLFLSLNHPPLYHVLTLWILRPSGTQGWGRWCTSMGARSATWEWTLARLIFLVCPLQKPSPHGRCHPCFQLENDGGKLLGMARGVEAPTFPQFVQVGKKLKITNLLVDLVSV